MPDRQDKKAGRLWVIYSAMSWAFGMSLMVLAVKWMRQGLNGFAFDPAGPLTAETRPYLARLLIRIAVGGCLVGQLVGCGQWLILRRRMSAKRSMWLVPTAALAGSSGFIGGFIVVHFLPMLFSYLAGFDTHAFGTLLLIGVNSLALTIPLVFIAAGRDWAKTARGEDDETSIGFRGFVHRSGPGRLRQRGRCR